MVKKTALIDKSKFPNEPAVDCRNCRMCFPQNKQSPYLSDLKCCTYFPLLPNYSVGAILSEGGKGAEIIIQMILNRQWVLPLGLMAPPKYQIDFLEKSPEDFGRNYDFRCPFLFEGNCSIWRHRNSECSTYFCDYLGGEVGKAEWFNRSEEVFAEEMAHSQNNMLELGYLWPDVETNLRYVRMTSSSITEFERKYHLDASKWGEFWKHWSDKPVEYYKKCWDLIV